LVIVFVLVITFEIKFPLVITVGLIFDHILIFEVNTLINNMTIQECSVAPVGDNQLRIHWLRNGQPLPHGIFFTID